MSSASSTAMEASVTASLGLPPEDELGRAQHDPIALPQLRALLTAPVHLHPVGRVEIDHPVRRALLPHLGVPPRNVRVGELDVAVLGSADHDLPLVELVLRSVDGEADDLAAEPELLRGDRLGLRRLTV